MSDDIVSVTWGEIDFVDMVELGFPPTSVTKEIVVCASKETRFGEVIISGTPELVPSDGIISVTWGETARVDMDKLG